MQSNAVFKGRKANGALFRSADQQRKKLQYSRLPDTNALVRPTY